MNHFAHLFLAQPTLESRVGNLLGDFCRGVDPAALPPAVHRGLLNHRAVDAFTDKHPLVRQAKAHFSDRRRRFAGVALDVLFDHYLIRHWDRFGSTARRAFVLEVYRDLDRGRALMPEPMQRVTRSMVSHDWFTAYGSLARIGQALDRIAGRIRFANDFDGIIEEIHPLDDQLESVFLEFFPELIRFVEERGVERLGSPLA